MITLRFDQETWGTRFPVFILDRNELQAFLSQREVDQLTDEDLMEIAEILKRELEELGFFDQLMSIARAKLTEKK
ncbi:hypothetical protein KSF_084100 [Reticulibacter mediterranei]|uniref:Uncharacterized protein n=1 Tax=Reticulibacter mediterranei TaxID=2778369 RepID=A0A8J3N4M4_9CHLR|nr:hypothetical protein [Reticulibacter mediterranei]GHO98362.1 hypothetical protein KSF_084100 [Reticulibacter mediterranei]